ncbi:MAG: type II toxin-antitoxin system HicB family antitoxin [Treponemataceae bacterium]
MKTIIPCKITFSEADEVWYVEAPDLYSGPITYGETIELAKAMAVDALTGLLESYIDEGKKIVISPLCDDPDWYPIEPAPGVAFALWLRNKRKEAGMTLTDVADRLGVKYQVYQKLENPVTANPTLKTLKKLEKVFGETLVAV